jgi:iron(III) transport system permease protein
MARSVERWGIATPGSALAPWGRTVALRAPWRLVMLGGLVALAVNLPLLYIFVRSVESGWQAYLAVVFSRASFDLLVGTVALAVGAAVLALVVALPLAWLVARTDLRARRVWALLGALPLVFPSYVSAFSLVAVFGSRGYVQGWLEPLGVERLPGLAYGYTGALLTLGLFTYPYVYLLVVAALRSIDPALEESARSLGMSRSRATRSVVLPQLRAPISAGTLLVVLYAISDFGAVSIVRYNTLTLSIYNAYRSLFDRSVAASMSTVLVLLALGFVALQALLLRRARSGPARPTRPALRIALGRWQWPCQLLLILLSLFTLGMPVGVVLHWGLRALAVGNPLGTAWHYAFNSVGVSVLAALAAVVLSLPIALWSQRFPGRPSRLAERLSYSGYALPGMVIALSLVFFATRYAAPLYQTLGLLVAAYVIRFLPEALSAARASLARVAPAFEEAARTLGRGPFGVLRDVTLPLVRPGLLAGAGLVFLTSMKELPATLILRPIGFETLATRVWSAASEGVYAEAALPALLLLLLSAPPVYLLTIRPALSERIP